MYYYKSDIFVFVIHKYVKIDYFSAKNLDKPQTKPAIWFNFKRKLTN